MGSRVPFGIQNGRQNAFESELLQKVKIELSLARDPSSGHPGGAQIYHFRDSGGGRGETLPLARHAWGGIIGRGIDKGREVKVMVYISHAMTCFAGRRICKARKRVTMK